MNMASKAFQGLSRVKTSCSMDLAWPARNATNAPPSKLCVAFQLTLLLRWDTMPSCPTIPSFADGDCMGDRTTVQGNRASSKVEDNGRIALENDA